MKLKFKLLIPVMLVLFASCSKDSNLIEDIDIRDNITGRWNAYDENLNSEENQRVVSIYKVEGSENEVEVVNLIKSSLFFNVSFDDSGKMVLDLSDSNINYISVERDGILIEGDKIELSFDFQGEKKKSELIKF